MKKNKKKKSILEASVSIGSTNLTQRALFARNLSVMLQSGLTIGEALEIAADSAQGKFKKILNNVAKAVKSGQSLSSSLSRYPKVFSGFFIGATLAGESSGTLEENLQNVATQTEKENELFSKVKGAMLYPIVVLVAAFILGIGMAFFVLPKITPLFEGLKMDLPATTRALIWSSHILQDYGLYAGIGLFVLIVFLVWLIRQRFIKPLTHGIFLKMPVVKKISRNANIARFCRSLGMLLKSGLNIDEALEITRTTLSNYYYKRSLAGIAGRITKGTKLSLALSEHQALFPIMVTRMIKVGEKSGKLEETLLYLANYYEVEVDNATKSLSTAIEPILLIVIGLVVGFLALSIITPIYNISGGIQG